MSKDLDALRTQIVNAIFAEMAKHPEQHDIRDFIDQPHDDLIGYHMTLGRDIRNNYGLWGHKTLSDNYIHPDDFSFEIIKELHIKAVNHFRQALFSIK